MGALGDRLRRSWNAFMGRDPTTYYEYYSSSRPDQYVHSVTKARSVVNSIYNRIAVSVSSININHVRVDENGNYSDTINSSLNDILTVEANIDQTGREFIQDVVMSMFDEGHVALVPVETDKNPITTDSYDIYSARTGKVIGWYPDKVRVEVYNERNGQREQIVLPKRIVPIVQNPFYETMNEPNSTLQRLLRTINMLDRANGNASSDKLNMIIQLPYVIRSDAKKKQADQRRREIEVQLETSRHGIAYTDGTEKIVQLNRPIENDLWNQVKELTSELYNKLGLTEKILNGTADEQEKLNFYNDTVEPILNAICENIKRKWLSKTARTQGQTIQYFRNPFKLVPVNQIAEMSNSLTRNEILSSNEFRAIIGFKPSNDPKADELRNSNLNHPDEKLATDTINEEVVKIQND